MKERLSAVLRALRVPAVFAGLAVAGAFDLSVRQQMGEFSPDSDTIIIPIAVFSALQLLTVGSVSVGIEFILSSDPQKNKRAWLLALAPVLIYLLFFTLIALGYMGSALLALLMLTGAGVLAWRALAIWRGTLAPSVHLRQDLIWGILGMLCLLIFGLSIFGSILAWRLMLPLLILNLAALAAAFVLMEKSRPWKGRTNKG